MCENSRATSLSVARAPASIVLPNSRSSFCRVISRRRDIRLTYSLQYYGVFFCKQWKHLSFTCFLKRNALITNWVSGFHELKQYIRFATHLDADLLLLIHIWYISIIEYNVLVWAFGTSIMIINFTLEFDRRGAVSAETENVPFYLAPTFRRNQHRKLFKFLLYTEIQCVSTYLFAYTHRQ